MDKGFGEIKKQSEKRIRSRKEDNTQLLSECLP